MSVSPAESSSPLSVLTGALPHERRALAIAFVQFFCVLASYYLLRPVRDQFSAAVGSTNLWQFWVGTFVVTLALVPVFGAMVARWPRETFVPAVNLFFAACLVGFVFAFQAQDRIGPRVLGIVFYIWLSVFNLCVVSVFWSFMADVFDGGQARRLFPAIAVGGVLGAIAGPASAALLPIQALLLLAIGLLLVATACTRLLVAGPANGTGERTSRGPAGAIGGGAWAGIRQVFASPFLRRMAALLLLGDAVGGFVYALTADVVGAHAHGSEARKTFYAQIDLVTNGLQLLLQVGATRWLMARFGAVAALVADSVLKVVVLLAVAVVGAPIVVPALVVTRAGSYGLGKPASDSLYARIEREARYKAKNAIDTAGWRFGDVVVSLSVKGLTSLGMGVAGFALIAGGFAALSGWFGWRAAHAPGLADDGSPESAGPASAP